MAKAPRKRVPGKQRPTGRARAKAVPRGVQAGLPQERALADVTHVLEGLEHPFAIIGGIAVIAWGFARLTADIDCTVAAPSSESRAILKEFERGGFEARSPDPVAFAEANLVLLLRHRATGVEIDVSLAQLEFEGAALRSAVQRNFGRTRIRVPTVTDLLIYKMVAGRPKDQQDVDFERVASTRAAFDEMLDTDRKQEWLRLWEQNQ